MRQFRGSNPGALDDAKTREVAVEHETQLRELSNAVKRLGSGLVPDSSGTSLPFDTSILDDYLYLFGRTGGQVVTQAVDGSGVDRIVRFQGTFSTNSSGLEIGSLGGGDSYISADDNLYLKTNTSSERIVSDQLTATTTSASAVPLIANKTAVATDDFFRVVNSVNTVLFRINKNGNIPDASLAICDDVDVTKLVQFQCSGITAATTRTLTIPNASGTIALTTDILGPEFTDAVFRVTDNADTSKKLALECSGITTATTRTLTIPNRSSTIATLTGTQTFDGAPYFENTAFDAPALAVRIEADGGIYDGLSGLVFRTATGFSSQVYEANLTADRYLVVPDGSGELLLGLPAQIIYNKTLQTSNTLRSNSASVGVAFEDNTVTTKKLRMVLSGAVGNNSLTFTNTAARNFGHGNLSGNVVIVGDDPPAVAAGNLGKVDLTAQAAAIGATNLTNAPPALNYLVMYTLLVTTLDATAGTIQFQISYTDTLGATTQLGAATVLTATGRDRGSFQVQLASGEISYQTNLVGLIGNARYALYVRVVTLG